MKSRLKQTPAGILVILVRPTNASGNDLQRRSSNDCKGAPAPLYKISTWHYHTSTTTRKYTANDVPQCHCHRINTATIATAGHASVQTEPSTIRSRDRSIINRTVLPCVHSSTSMHSFLHHFLIPMAQHRVLSNVFLGLVQPHFSHQRLSRCN